MYHGISSLHRPSPFGTDRFFHLMVVNAPAYILHNLGILFPWKISPTMTFMPLIRLVVATLRRTSALSTAQRPDGPMPVDVEHYTSGWNIADIKDFTKPRQILCPDSNKIS
jgi:hypothetical protein